MEQFGDFADHAPADRMEVTHIVVCYFIYGWLWKGAGLVNFPALWLFHQLAASGYGLFFRGARRRQAECDLFGHGLEMFRASVPINFHGQCAAITVTKPAGHGLNVHAGFNAEGGV